MASACARWAAFSIAVCAVVPATRAFGDTSFYVIPAFSIGRAHDDNLFSTPTDPQADYLWRFSPALEAGFESETLTLASFYTVDAERYAHYTGLDSNEARRNAALNLRYQASSRLSLALEGDYTSTNSLSELAPGTVVEPGREHARVLTLTPSLKYAFSELTTGNLGYTATRYELFGTPTTRVDTADVGLEQLLSRRDTLTMDYTRTQYDFGLGDTVDSEAIVGGWTHALSPDTSVILAVGPRDTEGSWSVDAHAGLRHTLETGNLSLDYVRSKSVVIGQAGTVDIKTATALLDFKFAADYELQLVPSYSSDKTGTSEADVTRFDLNLSYKLARDTSAVGSYQFNRQRGLLGGIGNPEILDRVVYLGLVFSFPTTTGNFAERQSSPFETLWPAPRH
ncbi:MAG: hypothetical protein ACM3ZT_02300 [Bacillota bacterium]